MEEDEDIIEVDDADGSHKTDSVETIDKPRKTRSEVWKFFERKSNRVVECSLSLESCIPRRDNINEGAP